MNIRADSKEVKFRLSQAEVGVLLREGFVCEEIHFPLSQMRFRVEFGEQTKVEQKAGELVFQVATSERDKFKPPFDAREAVALLDLDINGQNVCFKLEIDVFKPSRREQR